MFASRFARAVLVAGTLLSASSASFAQTGTSTEFEDILVYTFKGFAGTPGNAQALVTGLRQGTEVALQPAGDGCAPVVTPPPPQVPGGPQIPGGPQVPGGLPPGPGLPPIVIPPLPPQILPASFMPPTGNMGYGNVNIAMDLAQQQLANAGIPKPTPVQIRASFMGGSVRSCAGVTTELQGVLALRAAKKGGWGQVAAQLGLPFGAN